MGIRCNGEGEIVYVGEHDSLLDRYGQWGNVNKEEEGGNWEALGGADRDWGWEVGRTLED